MKKSLTLALAAVLMISILAVTATAATTTNLIPNDASKWKSLRMGEADATISFEGSKAIVSSTAGWPAMAYDLDKPLEIDPKTAYLNLKFKLVSGSTSIRLISGDTETGDQIVLHHFIKGITTDSAGDLNVPGTYQLSIAFKDLKCNAGTAADNYTGTKDLVLNSKGKFVLNTVEIFAITAKVEVEKFEISTTPDEVVSTPTESSAVTESAATSETVSSEVSDESSEAESSMATSSVASTASVADSSVATDDGNSNSTWIWVAVVAAVVVVGGGIAFFVIRKKK